MFTIFSNEKDSVDVSIDIEIMANAVQKERWLKKTD